MVRRLNKIVILSLFLVLLTISAAALQVETLDSSQITTGSFVVEGDLTSLGGNSDANVSFTYREIGSGVWSQTSKTVVGSTGVFQQEISGLSSNTSYEFRAVADNGSSSGTGELKYANTTFLKTVPGGTTSFRTENFTIETLGITGDTNVGTYWLRFRGEVSDIPSELAEPVKFNFSYRKKGADGWNNILAEEKVNNGVFNIRVEGLEPNTTYAFKATSKAGLGDVKTVNTTFLKTTTGGTVSMRTENFTVETLGITSGTNVGTYWLRFRGEVSDIPSELAEPVKFNFSYREEGSESWKNILAEEKVNNGVFNIRVEGLEPNTTYEYRAASGGGMGDPKTVNTTFLKTVSGGEISIRGGAGICDARGPENECIMNSDRDLGSEYYTVSSLFQVKDSAVLRSGQKTVSIDVFDTSFLSGVWRGSFEINADRPRVKPGAEFRPENGNIVIGNRTR
jgi:hypothetical protein